MKYTNCILLAFSIMTTTLTGAQILSRDSLVQPPQQLRTLDEKVDQISGDVTEIKRDVRTLRNDLVESPIARHNWGAEINPLSILFADKGASLTGTVSNFSWDRTAEVAFPFSYSHEGGDENGVDASTIFSLDAQYRRFLGSAQRGFYLSGFTRYQYAQYQPFGFSADNTTTTLNRVGIGFGLGGRIFSYSRLYWGWNLSLGRYILGDKIPADEYPSQLSLAMGDLILDMELLKIGFAL